MARHRSASCGAFGITDGDWWLLLSAAAPNFWLEAGISAPFYMQMSCDHPGSFALVGMKGPVPGIDDTLALLLHFHFLFRMLIGFFSSRNWEAGTRLICIFAATCFLFRAQWSGINWGWCQNEQFFFPQIWAPFSLEMDRNRCRNVGFSSGLIFSGRMDRNRLNSMFKWRLFSPFPLYLLSEIKRSLQMGSKKM